MAIVLSLNALSKGPIKSLSKISFHIHFKSHQRTCRTIIGLNQELTNALRSHDHDNEDEITTDKLVQLDDQVRTSRELNCQKPTQDGN